jgi:hypothetical protein
VKILLIAAGVLLAVLIVVYVAMKPPSPDPAMQRLGQLAELAERTCLSNTNDTVSLTLRVRLEAVKKLDATAGIEEQRKAARGAAEALSGELQKVENAEIRACMEPWAKQIREIAAKL